MGEEAFAAGSAESELEQASGEPVMVGDERGKLGWVFLTNDRILFTQQKFAATGAGGALGALAADQLQKRSEKKSGGPREVAVLADVRGGGPQSRRFLPDLYELRLADGSNVRLSKKLGQKWEPTIRRLVAERHGRTVTDEGDGWRAD